MPVRFDEVTDTLYRGGAPNEIDLRILQDIYGIERIVSLDERIGNSISPLVKNLGMEHLIIPIGGEESEDLLKFLHDNVLDILDQKPTYVHCRHGKDRTGVAVGQYRMRHCGWDKEDALKEAMRFGFGTGVDDDVRALYLKYMLGEDMNEVMDEDIVDTMRDHFQMGAVPPAFMPQQSMAPRHEVDKQAPPYPYPLRDVDRKRLLRRMLLEEMSEEDVKDVPMVGSYDNYTGIRGVGPVENQGLLNL